MDFFFFFFFFFPLAGSVYLDDSFCTSRTGLFEETKAANYPPVMNVKSNELWL